jgi:hypothetical protein
MATVAAKVVGGKLKEFDCDSVSELKAEMGLTGNYSAQINGEPADDDDDLNDHDFVTFTQSVKGGN